MSTHPKASLPDYYAVLGVTHDANLMEIKQAYRKLVREFHPDLNPSVQARYHFQQVQMAYDVLSDEVTRRQFDIRWEILNRPQPKVAAEQRKHPVPPPHAKPSAAPPAGRAAQQPTAAGPKHKPNTSKKRSQPQKPQNNSVGLNDVLGQFFEPFINWIQPELGPATETVIKRFLHLTLQECQEGGKKRVPLSYPEQCNRCSGSGRLNGKVCHPCDGQGMMEVPITLELPLAKGLKDGDIERFSVADYPGLIWELKVRVQDIPKGVSIEGADVYYDLYLNPPEMMLGGVHLVPCVGSPEKLTVTIPACCPLDLRVVLKSQGLAGPNGQGDYHVVVKPDWPTVLSEMEQKYYWALLKERRRP